MVARMAGLTATEKDVERFVKDAARQFGWLRYHTHRSDFSPAGFPDETLIRPPRLIFAELKGTGKQPSDKQRVWLDLLADIPGIEVFVWRPDDLDDIAAVLASGQPCVGNWPPPAPDLAPQHQVRETTTRRSDDNGDRHNPTGTNSRNPTRP